MVLNQEAIRRDFLTWSGGFSPESLDQIHVYCVTARPSDTDYGPVYAFLLRWFESDDPEWDGLSDEQDLTGVYPLSQFGIKRPHYFGE